MTLPRTLALWALLAGCGASAQTYRHGYSQRIHHYRLSISNVYAIETDEGTVIVDSGDPGQENDVLRAMAETEVEPESVRLIVVTHAHADHAGSAAALGRALGAPVALQRDDAPIAAAGHNPPLVPTSLTAELLGAFLRQDYEPFEPQVAFEDCLDLAPYGVAGVVRHTPGHTPGSSVVLLESGDAFVGDLFAGGYLGGAISPHIPTEHFFQEFPGQIRAILRWLLENGALRFYIGHGGPVTAASVREALDGGDLGEGEEPVFDPADCSPRETGR